MKINPTIFREYDIRGIAGKEFAASAVVEYERWYGPFPGITITLEAAEAIGQAYGTIIRREGGNSIVIGHEVRPFAEEIANAFIKGVLQAGCDVSDLGVSLTPVVYFTTAFKRFDGGVNVTGSHNVYFFNGFKLIGKGTRPIFGEELQMMRAMIEREDFIRDSQPVNYKKIEGFEDYKKYFLDHTALQKKFKVVIDCGNGSAGLFAPDLFRSLGCEVVELYSEPDATFPNHVPDPVMPQFMKDLQERVLKEHADLGIGFDADADRVGFVTGKGDFVDGDFMELIFTRDVLTRHPGKKVLYSVKSTQLLGELIPQYGGIPLMHRNGHAPIKETLRNDPDIIFGCEDTGHFFFVENYFKIDDGLFAAGKLLEILARDGKTLDKLVSEFPVRVRPPEIKLPCRDEMKFAVVEKIQKSLGKKFSIILIDGARIQVSDTAWGLIRASNTAPYLAIRVEGKDEEEVIRVKNILADELEKYPEVLDRLDRTHTASLTGKLGWR